MATTSAPTLTARAVSCRPRSHPGLDRNPDTDALVALLRDNTIAVNERIDTAIGRARALWGTDRAAWPVGVRTELSWCDGNW